MILLSPPALAPVFRYKRQRLDLQAEYVAKSEMFVTFEGPAVYMELRGEIARIPSFKNSHRQKFPGIDKDMRARIGAMDELFNAQAQFGPAERIPHTEPVHVLIILGNENKGDLDGATSTIMDWLEPSWKPVGKPIISKRTGQKKQAKRGWGIGLVRNDSQIVPFPVPCALRGIEHQHTVIVVQPLRVFREQCINFIAAAIGSALGVKTE